MGMYRVGACTRGARRLVKLVAAVNAGMPQRQQPHSIHCSCHLRLYKAPSAFHSLHARPTTLHAPCTHQVQQHSTGHVAAAGGLVEVHIDTLQLQVGLAAVLQMATAELGEGST